MAVACTNDQFIRTKLTNFVDFLTSCLQSRLDNKRFAEYSQKIEELRTIDTALWIMHVTEKMCPWRTNVAGYVTKLLAENAIDSKDLKIDELTKLCRYIECFIDTVSQ